MTSHGTMSLSEEHSLPEIEFSEEVLTKASLRGYLSPNSAVADVVILVHKNEGRVFLTDRNGFYNDVLTDAWVKTKGNVLIFLTSNRTPIPSDEVSNQDIKKMAQQGD